MDLVDPDVDRYLHGWASPDDVVLREMELAAHERKFPIVGPQVGRLLAVLARACGAKRIIELGSGFGYSAYWFARAIGDGGEVVLCERSRERADEAREYLARGGLTERVRIEVGDALEVLDRIGGEFDIVFNDIDKERYGEVLDPAAAALRHGGLLICDNMLWYGTVLDDDNQDPTTTGVRELTRALFASPDFETALLPIRDGVTVSVRR